MTIFTRDVVVDIDNFDADVTYRSGQGTALYFRGKTLEELYVAIQTGAIALQTDGVSLMLGINGHHLVMQDYIRLNGGSTFRYIKTDEEDGSALVTDIIESSIINLPEGMGVTRRGTTVMGTAFGDEIDFSDYAVPASGAGLYINGSTGNDVIFGTAGKDTILGAGGNDYIEGGDGNDTIVGGVGENSIVYTKEAFGVDTVTLTRGEGLTIDLSDFGFANADALKEGAEFRVNGANLEITLGNYGTIKLANFAYSNVVGDNGYVRIKLNEEGYVDLNEENLLEYAQTAEGGDFTVVGNNAVFSGSRFDETITSVDTGKATTISGGAGYNNITLIDNVSATDTVTGGNDGNHITITKDGIKSVSTGAGDDTIDITGDGTHTVRAGNGTNTVSIDGHGNNTVVGGIGDDTITIINADGVQSISASNGNNTVDITGNGNVTVSGGINDDIVTIDGDGTHTVSASNGDNTVNITGDGVTTVSGGIGVDNVTVTGNDSRTVLSLSNGDNIANIIGGAGDATITTGIGADQITVSNTGKNTISAGAGDDTITVTAGTSTIVGGAGHDTFRFTSGTGVATISDATNEDSIQITDVNAADLVFGRNRNNLEIFFDDTFNDNNKIVIQNYFARAEGQRVDELVAADGIISIAAQEITIKGSGSITGTANNDKIKGSDAVDYISGLAGDDTIYNSKGNDRLTGGAGANTYKYSTADFGTDTIVLTRGETATIDLSGLNLNAEDVAYSFENSNLKIATAEGTILLSNFVTSDITTDAGDVIVRYFDGTTESLRTKEFSVAPATNYSGNWHKENIDASGYQLATNDPELRGLTISALGGDDTIVGTKYSDTILGGAGDDTMIGGAGNDALTGGAGTNTYVFAGDFGKDTITLTRDENCIIDLSAFGLDEDAFKAMVKPNRGSLDITVSEGNVIKINNFATSDITGANGSVIVKLDNLTEIDLNHDNIISYAEGDYTSYNARTNAAVYAGTRFDETVDITGSNYNATINTNAGNDVILSGSGNDTINGGAGDDTITGGLGNDTITGSAGNDTFRFSKGDGVDTITDAVNGDVIEIVNARAAELRFMKAGNNLSIGYQNNNTDKITINNYFNNANRIEDIWALDNNDTPHLYKIADLLPEVYDITGKGVITGTANGENIYGSEVNDSINALGGNDTIYAGEGNDTIYGGDGNDVIYGGKGNDIVTGGAGANVVHYTKGDGNDTIILTRGENFTLDLHGLTEEDLSFEFSNGSLAISYDNEGTRETIKINNFANADVTNNETAATADTSSVLLTFDGADEIDLRAKVYDIAPATNYTGNWHKENIDASAYQLANDNPASRGLTINALGGDDTIVGTKYSDTIYGGDGDDVVVGGAGNDNLYGGSGTNTFVFTDGDGKDILYHQNGTDIIDLTATDAFAQTDINPQGRPFMAVFKEGNNLVIKYNGEWSEDLTEYNSDNSVSVPNYFANRPTNLPDIKVRVNTQEGIQMFDLQDVAIVDINYSTATSGKTVTGSFLWDQISGSEYNDTINAGAGTDIIMALGGNDSIYGGDGNDSIYGGDGDDLILGGRGNDSIYGEAENNVIVFYEGDGEDVVYSGSGSDTLTFSDLETLEDLKAGIELIKNGNHLVIKYSDTDTVTIDNYFARQTSVTTLESGNFSAISLAEFIDEYTQTKPISITGQGLINGTEIADRIIGSGYADVINGLGGNDTIMAKDGNDTMTGGTGTNTYVFEGTGFGNDIINLTGAENAILDFSGYDITEENIAYSFVGNNLVIKPSNYGQVTITNFKQSDITGENGSVTLKLAGGDVDLKAKIYEIETKTGYTGSWLDEEIDASEAVAPITIAPGKGNDVIFDGQGADTFIFADGDGQDVIAGADSKDRIIINAVDSEIDFERNGNNLEISYGTQGDRITVEDFYINNDNVDAILVKRANGTYNPISIKENIIYDKEISEDYVKNSPYKENLIITRDAENINISGLTTNDRITMPTDNEPVYTRTNNGGLVIDGRVTITDFFTSGNNFRVNYGENYTNTEAAVIGVTLTNGFAYAATGYEEVISGNGSVTGMGANDSISVDGEPAYTRTNDGALVINGALTVTDFNFDGEHDINVNEGTTEGMTLDVTLTNGFAYTSTVYNEAVSGNGSVSGLGAGDRIVVDGEPTYRRTNDGALVINDALTVTDFNFDGEHDININNGTTEGMTLNVALTDGFAYTATAYAEVISGSGSVTGMGAGDRIVVEGVPTYRRTNDGALVINDALTVTDFNFDGEHNINVNNGTTEGMTLNVALTDGFAYTATAYAETFTGNGTITGMGAGDRIVVEGVPTYRRTNDGALVINDALTVTDFNFDGEHNINVNAGTTEGMALNVTLTNGFAYEATAYAETFTGSGSVSGLTAQDNINFNDAEFSRKGNGDVLTVESGNDTINVTGFNFAEENTTVRVGGNLVDYTSTLYVDLDGAEYEATGYAEIFSGEGTITGMGAGDRIIVEGEPAYTRTNDGGLVINGDVTVADFNFDGTHNININNGTTEGMTLNVTLTDDFDYVATAYTEVFSGSGSVTGMGANDSIVFAEGTQVSYALGADGFAVTGGGNTIVVTDNETADLGALKVYVGETRETGAGKTLTVTGLSEFDGSDLAYAAYTVTGSDGNDELFGGAGNDVLSGGAGGDEIGGGAGNDTIYGGDADDEIIGGEGDDFLSGGAGNDCFIFGPGDGHDVVTDAALGDILTFEYQTNFSKFSFERGTAQGHETSLYVTYDNGAGNDVIEVQNYFTYNQNTHEYVMADGAVNKFRLYPGEANYEQGEPVEYTLEWREAPLGGGYAMYNIPQGGSVTTVNGISNWVEGTAGGDVITGGDRYDVLKGNAGDDTITAGAAGAEIYGGAGNDTLNGGAGNDYMEGGAGVDSLNGDAGNDTLYGGTGNDTINGGAGNNRICYTLGDGNDTVANGGGVDTLVFEAGTAIEAEYDGNNLVLTYSGNAGGNDYANTITITDFKTTANHSVKYVQVGNTIRNVKSYLPNVIVNGTDGDDTFTSEEYNETFNLGKGNDTINFGTDFGSDRINSTYQYGKLVTLNVPEYSLKDGSLTLSTEGDAMVLTATSADGEHGGVITINNLASNNTVANFTLNDMDANWHIFGEVAQEVTNNTTYYNDVATHTHGTSYQNQLFVLKSPTDGKYYGDFYAFSYGGNEDYQMTNAFATVDGTDLYYVYGNNYADDRVWTIAGDDTYVMDTNLTAAARLSITDMGGDDTLVFAKQWLEDVKPIFNINSNGTYDNENMTVVHSDMITAENFAEVYNSSEIGIKINATGLNGEGEGIETISAIGHTVTDAEEWKDAIAGAVAPWLRENHFESVDDAVANGSPEQIEELYGLFSADYTSGLESRIQTTDIMNYQRVLFGTEESETLLISDVANSGDAGYDQIFSYGGDDTIIVRPKNILWGNASVSYQVNTLYFKPGDGNDTVLNSERLFPGVEPVDYSDQEAAFAGEYVNRDSNFYNGINLSFKDVAPEDLSVRQDGDDILITYQTRGTTIDGTDTDDTIIINSPVKKIRAGRGDDEITVSGDGVIVEGNEGNDIINIRGNNNIVKGSVGFDSFLNQAEDRTSTTFEFSIGDDYDIVMGGGTLKFINTTLDDINLGNFGDDLVLWYHSRGDYVRILGYNSETFADEYTLVDETGAQISLGQFVEEYEGEWYEPRYQMYATADDDYTVVNHVDNVWVNTSLGDDRVLAYTNESYISTGDGNDYIQVTGDHNVIDDGRGNDVIDTTTATNSTMIIYNGNGHDRVTGSTRLQFENSALADMSLSRFGNDLILSHNSGADSITISDYFNPDNESEYVILDSEDERVTLAEFVADYGDIPDAGIAVINGTDTDDEILVKVDGLEVNGGAGDDAIESFADAVTINGGTGNDFIGFSGADNVIVGGAGNDVITDTFDSHNNGTALFVFSDGDGDDLLDASGTIQLTDTSLDGLTLEKMGDDLILKHNSGKDSVRVIGYYGGENEYTLVDSEGEEISLDDFVDGYEGEIREHGTDELNTVDTVRIVNGFNSTNVYSLTTYISDEAGESYYTDHYGNKVYTGYNERAYIKASTYYGHTTDVSLVETTGSFRLVDALEVDPIVNETGASQTLKGWIWHDNITAGDNGDTIVAYSGDDTITGGAGNDTIYGENGYTYSASAGNYYGDNDTIHGGAGNDRIDAGSGTDTVYGDEGNDIIIGSHRSPGYIYDWVDEHSPEGWGYIAGGKSEETGIDVTTRLYGGEGSDTIYGAGYIYADDVELDDLGNIVYNEDGTTNHVGTAGNDTVWGYGEIHTGDGDDTITTLGGASRPVYNSIGWLNDDDIIEGLVDAGAGDDTIILAGRYDVCGDTTILAGDGNDEIRANEDRLSGNGIYGGAGNDHFYMYTTNEGNYVDGGAGNDVIELRTQLITNDNVDRTKYSNTVKGGAGDDLLVLMSDYNRPTMEYYTRVGSNDTVVKRIAPLAFFDLELNNDGSVKSIGEDVYINSGYKDDFYEGDVFDTSKFGKKDEAILIDGALTNADKTETILIKNTTGHEYGEVNYTDKNGYRELKLDNLKNKYITYMRANGLTSLETALTDETHREALAQLAMSDDVWEWTLKRPEFESDVEVIEGDGTDKVLRPTDSYRIFNRFGNGERFTEYYKGTNANETINATGGGADYIEAGGGNDVIYAGYGDDVIYGGTGNNTIVFEAGTTYNDNQYITAGHDVVYSTPGGHDTLVFDTVVDYGRNGRDLIIYHDFENQMYGVQDGEIVFNPNNERYSSVTVKDYFANTTGNEVTAGHSVEYIQRAGMEKEAPVDAYSRIGNRVLNVDRVHTYNNDNYPAVTVYGISTAEGSDYFEFSLTEHVTRTAYAGVGDDNLWISAGTAYAYGGEGNDEFTIAYSGANGGLDYAFVDGGEGSDTYNIYGENAQISLVISDTGATGIDKLTFGELATVHAIYDVTYNGNTGNREYGAMHLYAGVDTLPTNRITIENNCISEIIVSNNTYLDAGGMAGLKNSIANWLSANYDALDAAGLTVNGEVNSTNILIANFNGDAALAESWNNSIGY